MDEQELIEKIILKKEFSQLPKKDVELVFSLFNKEDYIDSEKVKLTRDLLRKIYSGFTSLKLLKVKNKDFKWILNKHLSTRERFPYYDELYERLLKGLDTQGCTPKNISKNIFTRGKKLTIFDLGAGVNGFSYNYFPKDIKYIGVEAIGQLVDLMNNYFINGKLNAKAIHKSLFDLEEIKKLIKEQKKIKVIFLFKIIDSLEMLERNYSKKLLTEIVPLVERVVVSFATRSMRKRKKFRVNRNWILNFIKENYNILDDFEIGSERYIVFSK